MVSIPKRHCRYGKMVFSIGKDSDQQAVSASVILEYILSLIEPCHACAIKCVTVSNGDSSSASLPQHFSSLLVWPIFALRIRWSVTFFVIILHFAFTNENDSLDVQKWFVAFGSCPRLVHRI